MSDRTHTTPLTLRSEIEELKTDKVMLRASLERVRDKLRDLIHEHTDPGADALAAVWEASEVLQRHG